MVHHVYEQKIVWLTIYLHILYVHVLADTAKYLCDSATILGRLSKAISFADAFTVVGLAGFLNSLQLITDGFIHGLLQVSWYVV